MSIAREVGSRNITCNAVAQDGGHGGFDESGRDGVASNVAGADLAGDSHGEADESGLRGGVINLSRLAHLAEDAGDVDDASPALFEHGADDLLDTEVGRGGVGLEDGVP